MPGPFGRARSRDRWAVLWRLTGELAGQTDELAILRTALAESPALFGCGVVEIRLRDAAHRPALQVVVDVEHSGKVDVRLGVEAGPDSGPDVLTVPLVGGDGELGTLRLSDCTSRGRRRRRSLALAFAHLLSSSLGAAHALAEERKLVEETTRRANQDGLTTLGNRRLLTQWGDHLLGLSDARKNTSALLLFDLDDFKRINDTLGHEGGDQVLAELGVRIQRCVRHSDLAVRLGGDEFAVLAVDLHGPEEADQLAGRLLDAIAQPVLVDDVDVRVLSSAGIALHRSDGDTIAELMRAADLAMYAAKADGPGGARRAAGGVQLVATSAMAEELGRGLLEDQLVLHYEPQVDLSTGRVTGFEALARWQHPELGLIAPQDFVPLVERSGLMRRLTTAVLDRALAEYGALERAVPGVTVSVNISARNLLGGGLVSDVERLLREHQVASTRLTLEVTEPNAAYAGSVSEVFERLGCGLSVSGYGAGTSSLTALAQYPGVREIKLDAKVASEVVGNAQAARLALTVITAGHSLGMTVVADGVTTAETLEGLRRLGCDVVQGEHIHPPAPVDDIAAWATHRDLTGLLQ